MQKLIIEVNSENWDFIYSLDIIKEQINNWFTSWFDSNSNENFTFEIK